MTHSGSAKSNSASCAAVIGTGWISPGWPLYITTTLVLLGEPSLDIAVDDVGLANAPKRTELERGNSAFRYQRCRVPAAARQAASVALRRHSVGLWQLKG